ncbi:penicillin-binding protein activator [Marinobacter zhejiangensis]|uniref:LppC lipoprotein n=1 Tax=Marinobacter zhejiangensis TaxID=488535 RepID=A0A1I4TAS4_9GAMM|nr:penicillin-binding protein activator [Marinobacter zhejiangensis]SFM73703.1 hypothetical protein SAMN04487963_3525 [Marinobacter zhejiangensis]
MTKKLQNSPLVAALLAASVLGGCTSINLETHTPLSASEAVSLAADENDPMVAQSYLLRSASNFQEAGNHSAARQILKSPSLSSPNPQLLDQYLLLAMASAVELKDSPWAEQLADRLAPSQFQNYQGELVSRAGDLQASTYLLAQRPLDAALTLMAMVDAGITTDVQATQDQIWQALKQTSDTTLSGEAQRLVGYTPQGWVELAAIMREPGATLDSQGRKIRDWQYNWTSHPAASTLPSELLLITTLARQRPESIALALPLSGPLAKAGEAIRDGFLSAFYQDESTAELDINITMFDTNDTAFEELYQKILATEPDLIVGPLRKESLAELTQHAPLPVPVLALNYLPENSSVPAQFYQFGLAAEDEARQIAERLHSENRDQVLALFPDGDWGSRFEQALDNALAENNGKVLDSVRFLNAENLRTVSAGLLGIEASRQRAIDVERTIGLNVEFEPRRRQDADAIVMVAPPTIARQFKPMFAFYFGGDLPVYSPSLVYEGDPAPNRDRDLNGVRFTDIPWILGEENEFRDDALAAFGAIGGQLGRLFAMGADAYQIGNRLTLLQQVDDAALDGQTGRLTMTPDGKVQRQQQWALFQNGTPTHLADVPEPTNGNGSAGEVSPPTP